MFVFISKKKCAAAGKYQTTSGCYTFIFAGVCNLLKYKDFVFYTYSLLFIHIFLAISGIVIFNRYYSLKSSYSYILCIPLYIYLPYASAAL